VQPRSLRIFDLDAQRPGAVSLFSVGATRGNNTHWLEFHSLDTLTGKLANLTDVQVSDNEAVLLDRQGRLRLTLPNTTRYDFPFRYAYLGPKGGNRAKPLDEAFKLAGFSVSPDNYFGERAIPLGFDENPDLLYYAANTGRDTYGIYSLNLTTGQRGALTMEHPVYDLIGPPESAPNRHLAAPRVAGRADRGGAGPAGPLRGCPRMGRGRPPFPPEHGEPRGPRCVLRL
jgi:hypothetical protein